MHESDLKFDAVDCFDLECNPDIPPLKISPSGASQASAVQFVDTPSGRYATAILSVDDCFCTPPIMVSADHIAEVGVLYPAGHFGEAVVILEATGAPERAWFELGRIVAGASPSGNQQSVRFDLSFLHGKVLRLRLRVGSITGAPGCLVSRFGVFAAHQGGLVNGLNNYAYRFRVETAHFSSGQAYTHPMYGSEEKNDKKAVVDVKIAEPKEVDTTGDAELGRRLRARLAAIVPVPDEATYNFAMRCLQTILPMQPPDFIGRAAQKGAEKSLRILSICSGAARIEEMILDRCTRPVSITLVDCSEDLCRRAAARLAKMDHVENVDVFLGDINKGLPARGPYDIALCVSALHHVVELERVLSQINACLTEDGEFWSIGEQIGRNGCRLWPRDLAAANQAMAILPPKYKKNATSGAIDAELPDIDCSMNAFEGIRSEELEQLLESYFIPVNLYKRNCFLWRVIGPAYGDNFAITSPVDAEMVRELVAAEVLQWARGGRSTELHGVYRKKTLNLD